MSSGQLISFRVVKFPCKLGRLRAFAARFSCLSAFGEGKKFSAKSLVGWGKGNFSQSLFIRMNENLYLIPPRFEVLEQHKGEDALKGCVTSFINFSDPFGHDAADGHVNDELVPPRPDDDSETNFINPAQSLARLFA